MKKFVSLLLAMLMVLSLVACGGDGGQSNTNSGDKVIKIGVFEPLSGDSASGGKKEVLGMQYANSETPTVELNGETYKVELVLSDNGSSTDKAPTAASDLVFPSSSALSAPARPWPAAPSSVMPASPPSA